MPELFAKPEVVVRREADGSVALTSAVPLGAYPTSMAQVWSSAADELPDQVLATERDGGRITGSLTYAQARMRTDAIGQALLELGLSAERPLLVLSGNSIDHLLLTLACYTAGIPIVPLSEAYSLRSRDYARLRTIAERVRPGAVFAPDAQSFAGALAAIAGAGARVLVGREDLAPLESAAPGAALRRARAAVGPDTVAKILFTSGSTGDPKGVLNTHRMLSANQQMMRQVWPFLARRPMVLADWLPWSHTFGGNHNLHMLLFARGTLHIDGGRPTPELVGRTLDLLREVRPTVYFNVPAGYQLLVAALENDDALAANFFADLTLMFTAAAPLPAPLRTRLERLAAAHVTTRSIPLTTSWGATETGPAVTSAHFESTDPECIGAPLPGTTVKLVPRSGTWELRVAGPQVTPGYLGDAQATAAAFDEEGFYCTGDAGRLVSAVRPESGVAFAGRIAEDFKLLTGTWVRVGALRKRIIEAAEGLLSDVVLTGEGRDYVGALVWPGPTAPADLRPRLAEALATLGRDAGSAARLERVLILDEAPRLDAGEITDKGYVNQAVVRARRRDAVERLYRDVSGLGESADIIVLGNQPTTMSAE